jgi:hypothetical protein
MWKYYYENGQIKALGGYCGGLACGVWSFYDVNGTLRAEGAFRDGYEKYGRWQEWTAKGDPAQDTCSDPNAPAAESPFLGGSVDEFGKARSFLYELGWSGSRVIQFRFENGALMRSGDRQTAELVRLHAD